MSKVSGLLLVASGIALAALGTKYGPEANLEGLVAQNQAPLSESAPRPSAADREMPPVGATALQIVAPPTKPTARPAPRPTEAVPARSEPVVITLPRRPSESANDLSPKTAAIPDRASLARELQRELRRVGCYEGEINGSWTPPTRRAMKAFTDRVNAILPVDVPDYILLTLVQGHQDHVCSKPCSAGQGLSDDGRCVPNAILAQAARKPAAPSQATAPAPSAWAVTTMAAPPSRSMPVIEGRMALAGPQSETNDGPSRRAAAPNLPRGASARPDARAPRVAQRKGRRLDVKAFFQRLDVAGRP